MTGVCDFSLRHYGELLEAARAGGYRFAGFDRAEAAARLVEVEVEAEVEA